MDEITSTHEMAEAQWDGPNEPQDVDTNMVATTEAEGRGIEFHVSMRSYTQRDMEALIVEAAARVVVGEYGNNKLAKLVEERCIALSVEKIDKHLANVTAEIIDQPITPKFPFMKADEKPMTMREFIGLTGREYLTASVDSSGKPTNDRYYGKTRIQSLVEGVMQQAFKTEIEKATNAAVSEVRNAIKAEHDAFLTAEKARLREALAKLAA
ncbi:hypothetical protein [Kaistia granuli]|uniref:hypothetical protein n=1 Tax=Kaistia granuli TaxID=363259 RepID=UPI0003605ECC|nr:hypothetical protein [Kaistia granuli]